MNSELAWRVEDACFNAWPALRSVYHGDWLLRFGDGLSRRSNSVNPLRAVAVLAAADIALFENLYRGQGLPLIVRVPSLLDPVVDRELERLGFVAEGGTCALFGELSAPGGTLDQAVEISSAASNEWLAAMSAMQGHTPEQVAIYRRVVDRLALPAGFAALRQHGAIVAMAYGTVEGDLLCCESVIVSENHRGQGLGRRLMASLLAWAASRGATGACLQVVAANVAGRALYRSIGLTTELHRYHYRRAPSDKRHSAVVIADQRAEPFLVARRGVTSEPDRKSNQ
jgi:ribosomal protein S18 acetylase RimI-like enzyme